MCVYQPAVCAHHTAHSRAARAEIKSKGYEHPTNNCTQKAVQSLLSNVDKLPTDDSRCNYRQRHILDVQLRFFSHRAENAYFFFLSLNWYLGFFEVVSWANQSDPLALVAGVGRTAELESYWIQVQKSVTVLVTSLPQLPGTVLVA